MQERTKIDIYLTSVCCKNADDFEWFYADLIAHLGATKTDSGYVVFITSLTELMEVISKAGRNRVSISCKAYNNLYLQIQDTWEKLLDIEVYDYANLDSETLDQYTILLLWTKNGRYYDALGISADPENYQSGTSQFSTALRGNHLGKRIQFSNLPPKAQEHVLRRLNTRGNGE